MTDEDSESEFVRFQSKIQLGEGVDRRGDVTVEMLRERPSLGRRTQHQDVELPSGETVTITTDDEAFAEFYFELQRTRDVLRRTLGLDRDDE